MTRPSVLLLIGAAGLACLPGVRAAAVRNVEAVRIVKSVAPGLVPNTGVWGPPVQATMPAWRANDDCRAKALEAKAIFLTGKVQDAQAAFVSIGESCHLSDTTRLFRALAKEGSDREAAVRELTELGAGPFLLTSTEAALRAGDYSRAAHAAGLAESIDGLQTSAALSLGRAEIERRELTAARRHFMIAAADPALAPDAEYWLGIVDLAEGHPEVALARWERLLDGHPSVGLILALGDLTRDSGNPQAAREYYTRAIGLEPGRPEPYYGLGRLSLEAGDAAQAARDFGRATAGAPANPGYQLYLARALDRIGRTDAADRAYDRAVTLAAGDPDLLWYDLERARFQVRIGQVDKARLGLTEVMRRRPGSDLAREAEALARDLESHHR